MASLGFLPVILSGIKHCDSQQSDYVSNMVKFFKMACVGDNSITKLATKAWKRLGVRLPEYMFAQEGGI